MITILEKVRAGGIAARNALLGGNVASLRLLRNPRQFVRYASETLFLYNAMDGGRGVPEASVADILGAGDTSVVHLGNLRGEHWFGPVGSYAIDIVSLCLISQIIKPRVVFEIGTLNGYTALHFALNSPPEALVYTLDLPRDVVQHGAATLATTLADEGHIRANAGRTTYCFTGTPPEPKIRPLFGDSATFDFSPYHGSVDLMFVDGAHSYEYVRSDTLRAMACVRAGGVICWHDFGRAGVNGVSRWLREFRAQGNPVYCVPGGSLAFMVRQ
jgi:predicted O-methyltransferase YrrM